MYLKYRDYDDALICIKLNVAKIKLHEGEKHISIYQKNNKPNFEISNELGITDYKKVFDAIFKCIQDNINTFDLTAWQEGWE